MERRRLGGLEVSAVGLGCATMTPFYDQPDPESAIATIRRAREIGVDFLDTSDAYGAGRNEELIARAVAGHRGDYVIASKFGNLSQSGGPRFSDGRPEYVREACEKSLKRLQTDVIDLYYIHRVDPEVPIEDTVGAMADLVSPGQGAPSRHLRSRRGDDPAGARGASDERGADRVFAVDPRCRGRDPAAVRGTRHRLCRVQPVGARLSDRRGDQPRFAARRRRAPPHAALPGRESASATSALVEELKAHAAAERVTPAQLAIAWVLSRRPFIVPIAGTSHVERLEQNAAAAGLRISADTQDALEHIFAPGAAAGARYPAGHLERLMI